MFKVVSEEFQTSLRIRQKALPLSSAKDDLQQYFQQRGTGFRQVTNKLLAIPKRLLTGQKNLPKKFLLENNYNKFFVKRLVDKV